jgi:hypothetical protein
MINVQQIQDLERFIIHKVGNSSQDEPLLLSQQPFELQDETVTNLLLTYFIQPFTNNGEYFRFTHEADIQLNEIYKYCSLIFEDKESFTDQSVNIAKHLYKHSTHPKIKGGELYIVYFSKCLVDGEEVEAVGIFKSENKDTYLKVFLNSDNYEVNYDDGINISKLDKGCLVYNLEKDEGYKVSVIDSVGKQNEAVYWKDAFLQVVRREDNYQQTETMVNLCKQFVEQRLPEEYDMNRADQIDLLNRTATYFKEKENFQMEEFATEVLGNQDAIESFKEYREHYQQEYRLDVPDEFEISGPAMKKQQRIFKSILKLDRNFHVYIHGNRELIERGFDEASNMQFYKLFFEEEK